jgi:hypothetical protein
MLLMCGLLTRSRAPGDTWLLMPQLAHARDVANMSEEGIAGLFVNAHGFVHDMVTLRKVQGLARF